MDIVLSVVSWRKWGILRYNSIWQNLAALFYLALVEQHYSPLFLGRVFLFTAFSTVMTGFGYLVNDLSDVELDRQHGKPNAFHNTGRLRAGLTVLGVLVVGFFLGLPFLESSLFGWLWLLWILAAVSYSFPPLRLKERGMPGLLMTIAAQQTLPAAMLFTIFGDLFSPAALVFILFATVRGYSSDLSHQMRELDLDAASGVETFAVRAGRARTQQLYAASLELERMVLGAVIALLLLDLPAFNLLGYWIPPALPLALFYLLLFVLSAGASLRALSRSQLSYEDPYDEKRQLSRRDKLHVIHHTLPSVLLPLYLSAWMSLNYWPNLIFIFLLFALFGLYSPRRWTGTWPLRPLLAYLRTVRS